MPAANLLGNYIFVLFIGFKKSVTWFFPSQLQTCLQRLSLCLKPPMFINHIRLLMNVSSALSLGARLQLIPGMILR